MAVKITNDDLSVAENFEEPLDQSARYRNLEGKTLTEIQQSKQEKKLNPVREGLMAWDNRFAEMKAKIADPRYTDWIEGEKLPMW